MWIATEKGFYSIVINTESKNENDKIIVRARRGKDLENIFEKRRVIKTEHTNDYVFRVFCSRDELMTLLFKFGHELNYPNFKSHVGKTKDQKDKLFFYNKIWETMNKYQRKYGKGLYNYFVENFSYV